MDQNLHRIIRLSELPRYVALGRTRIRELIATGQFPAPIRLSDRRLGWLETDVVEWQQARIALSRAPVKGAATVSNDAKVPTAADANGENTRDVQVISTCAAAR